LSVTFKDFFEEAIAPLYNVFKSMKYRLLVGAR